MWTQLWPTTTDALGEIRLLLLAEQADERVALRVRVLRDNAPDERVALRQLDSQLVGGLTEWAVQHVDDRLTAWPPETRRWWRSISTMPHCTGWSDGDWQFALDTAQLVAAFHNGDHRHAQEIRRRERIMGTTADARRDLRIRYVDDGERDDTDERVIAMASYRRIVGADEDDTNDNDHEPKETQ